ncbi:hypothetical protein H6S82_13725 [Planktothrix sp. FACHB-1355]|uniref:Uncharacterized protein n=1 Tax=Aerosakkonema funiforme FACHB-1375 TaxID=2949571 RepID=A0A926VKF9_9CYAN|nr:MULTISPECIES: hypothetical protein [Oscillatoriales]MBD2184893.1 hypothetical protein [Aerosakkonema funiforme FACHB-1375]MBD3559914.1 hypothetical protein [Planktothrix sp. FACHB-1355]
MQNDINFPMIAIVNDLDALITEIDQNPQLSSWVVRLVLKSIKDKARNMVIETAPTPVSTNQVPHLEALSNSSAMGTRVMVLK